MAFSTTIAAPGEVPERPNGPDSKSGVSLRAPRVRIPASPPKQIPRYTRQQAGVLVLHQTLVADLFRRNRPSHPDRVEIDHRVDVLQRSRLPLPDLNLFRRNRRARRRSPSRPAPATPTARTAPRRGPGSPTCPAGTGVGMPRAYIEITFSSKPGSRRAYRSTSCGSKRPLRSRGTSRSIAPASVSTRLRLWPLRWLPASCSPSRSRCASISASSARSATAFFKSSIGVPLRNASAASYPARSSSRTSSLIFLPRVWSAIIRPP